jgi:hypothetical protein
MEIVLCMNEDDGSLELVSSKSVVWVVLWSVGRKPMIHMRSKLVQTWSFCVECRYVYTCIRMFHRISYICHMICCDTGIQVSHARNSPSNENTEVSIDVRPLTCLHEPELIYDATSIHDLKYPRKRMSLKEMDML